jgi:hypothetical protein
LPQPISDVKDGTLDRVEPDHELMNRGKKDTPEAEPAPLMTLLLSRTEESASQKEEESNCKYLVNSPKQSKYQK